jgi:solute carrier family 29 (equilibrative nucleoside transporter), member 1/2/3
VHSTSPYLILHPILFNYLHFLIFNISDWTGRSLCSHPRLLVWNPRALLSLSLARVLFIPFFLLCNIYPRSPSNIPIINSDLAYFLLLTLFGLSNGYVMSLCMMAAPSLEHNKKLRRGNVEIAATIVQFCLIVGLSTGSMSSFGVRAAVCWCNPFKA